MLHKSKWLLYEHVLDGSEVKAGVIQHGSQRSQKGHKGNIRVTKVTISYAPIKTAVALAG